MRHREKLEHFYRLLEERGWWKANARPPIFVLLWKLGLEVPPPYFLTMRQAILGVGGAYGLIFFLVLAAGLWWLGDGAPGPVALFFLSSLAAAVGLAFGAAMGLWWGWQRERLELPSWAEYPQDPRERTIARSAASE